MIPVLTIDTRLRHEICSRRGCNADALPDNNLCKPHRDDQRARVRRAMKKARATKASQASLPVVHI
jgi:hypothetical protein